MLTFPHNDKTRQDNGYSLLEILVVLAITSVMLTLVSVRLVQSIESNYFIQSSKAAIAEIKILRAQAILNSKRFVLITDDTSDVFLRDIDLDSQRRLNLPHEWSVLGQPVEISPFGFCSGGVLTITDKKGRLLKYRLEPPKCEAVRFRSQAESPSL